MTCSLNLVGASSDGKTSRVKRPEQHVHMPPELLVNIDVPIDVIKSLYLLPSMMYRLESLMLASQLRQEINCSNLNIPSSLVCFSPLCFYLIVDLVGYFLISFFQ